MCVAKLVCVSLLILTAVSSLFPGSNGAMEEGEEEDENGENMTEGVDLSSINAMLSTVMNAGQLNGAMEPSSAPASTASISISKTTPPRPTSVNRNARRNTVQTHTHVKKNEPRNREKTESVWHHI